MVKTETKQIPLGWKAPDFNLFNPYLGKSQSLNDLYSNKCTVVIFMCNHCPYVKHIMDQLKIFGDDMIKLDVSVIAINSNDYINYPQDSPENMSALVKEYDFKFPYLFDETQEVAKLYKAECTPDFNVFDKDLLCVYRGQFDYSRPGNSEIINGVSLREAVDLTLIDKVVDNQIPSVGCNIKWF